MKTLFITGTTGFLGSHFLYHILQHSDHKIICLGRDNKYNAAEQRVLKKLQNIHTSYLTAGVNSFDLEEKIKKNLNVVSGDIRKNNFGLDGTFDNINISEFWHFAANVQFSKAKTDSVIQTNVGGGKNVLKFVKANKIPVLNFVSTAYVAGQKKGIIYEDLSDENFEVNNSYELSKRIIEKEIIAANMREECNFRIFRPAIIVGHSLTCEHDESFGGLYGFLYLFASLKKEIEYVFPSYFKNNPVQLQADKNSALSLITVDHVVDLIFYLGNENATINRIHHITPKNNIGLIDLLEKINDIFGIQIIPVSGTENLNTVDRLFNRLLCHYKPYLNFKKVFRRKLTTYKDDFYQLNNEKIQKMMKKFYCSMKIQFRLNLTETVG